MIHRVADHVHQRIGDRIDHVAIELRLLTVGHQFHDLAGLQRHVAHKARELLERGLHGDHAHGHAQVLQLAHDLAGLRHLLHQIVLAAGRDGGIGGDHGLRNDQFADHVDQSVESIGAHAHGQIRVVLRGAARGLRTWRGVDRGGGCRRGSIRCDGDCDRRTQCRCGSDSRFDASQHRIHVQQVVHQERVIRRQRDRLVRLHRRLDRLEELAKDVVGAEREVGDRLRVWQLAIADAAEQRFRVMREIGELVQSHERGRAFHGVEGTEDGVDRLDVFRIRFQFQQRRFGARHGVTALGNEVTEQREVGIIGNHAAVDCRRMHDDCSHRRGGHRCDDRRCARRRLATGPVGRGGRRHVRTERVGVARIVNDRDQVSLRDARLVDAGRFTGLDGSVDRLAGLREQHRRIPWCRQEDQVEKRRRLLRMGAHLRRGRGVEHRKVTQRVTQGLDVLVLRRLELHDDERGVVEFSRNHGNLGQGRHARASATGGTAVHE